MDIKLVIKEKFNCSNNNLISVVLELFIKYCVDNNKESTEVSWNEFLEEENINSIASMFSILLDTIKIEQKDNLEEEEEFCCSQLMECMTLENDTLKIIYSKNSKKLQLSRKFNDNPVFYRDDNNKIYRCNGEINYLKKELLRLAHIKDGEFFILNKDFKYD